MKNTLQEKIKAAIKENLPAEVGEALKEQLIELEILRGRNEAGSREVRALTEENKKLKAQLDQHASLDSREVNLTKREVDVKNVEIMQEVTLLKTKLEESEKRADMVKEFTSGLVRNTDFRSTIFDSEQKSGYMDDNGKWIPDQRHTKTYNKDTTAD